MADVGGVPPLAFDAQDFVQRPDEEVPDEVVDHGKKRRRGTARRRARPAVSADRGSSPRPRPTPAARPTCRWRSLDTVAPGAGSRDPRRRAAGRRRAPIPCDALGILLRARVARVEVARRADMAVGDRRDAATHDVGRHLRAGSPRGTPRGAASARGSRSVSAAGSPRSGSGRCSPAGDGAARCARDHHDLAGRRRLVPHGSPRPWLRARARQYPLVTTAARRFAGCRASASGCGACSAASSGGSRRRAGRRCASPSA